MPGKDRRLRDRASGSSRLRSTVASAASFRAGGVRPGLVVLPQRGVCVRQLQPPIGGHLSTALGGSAPALRPSAVPWIAPPCIRHRVYFSVFALSIAGELHGVPLLVFAPHRGAVDGFPPGLPFFRLPAVLWLTSYRHPNQGTHETPSRYHTSESVNNAAPHARRGARSATSKLLCIA